MPRIFLPASFPLATGLAWAATVLTTVRFLRRRGDARLAAHWWTVLLLTLSLTLTIPSVHLSLDHVLRLPNAAFWLTDALALGSAYMADTFFYALAHGAEYLRWHRPWFLATLALALVVMAVALWRLGLRTDLMPLHLPRVDPALVAYRLVFLAFLGVVIVRVIGSAVHYRRRTADPLVKIGMSFLLVAGVWGFIYLICSLATALLPATVPLAQMLNAWLEVSVFMGILCLAVATLVPQWGTRLGIPALARHLDAVRAYWRLRPLWRALTQVCPEVVLPLSFSRRAALWHPQELDLLLRRCVIEILDVRRLLLAPASHTHAQAGWILTGDAARMDDGDVFPRDTLSRDARTTRHRGGWPAPQAVGIPDPLGQRTWQAPELEQLAHSEARLLVRHLNRDRRSRTPDALRAAVPLPIPALHQPATFEEAISYLQQVAAACRRERRRSMRARLRFPVRSSHEDWCEEEREYA